MIKVNFTEPATPEWAKWKADAQKEIAELKQAVDQGNEPKISDALYKRMRHVFYDAFHGKCAYCERKFVLDQSGDIDHFRPKGAVTDEKDQVVKVPGKAGPPGPHPGYYWLAYDWRNLLPTCARCNRPARLPDGRLVGKSTRFPVRGQHIWEPGKEDQESPLFLHPVFDNPQEHLGIKVEDGVFFAKTPRGQTCIDLLDLNREGLPEERQKRYTQVKGRVWSAVTAIRFNQPQMALDELAILQAFERGEEELAWAAQLALREEKPWLGLVQQQLGP